MLNYLKHLFIYCAFFFYIFILLFINVQSLQASNKIIIASTTSTYDTGFLTYLNSVFTKKFDIDVQVLSQGTGQAIRTAKDGNVEVLLVHHTESEIKFMNNGFGLLRYDLMYNDFIIVGPKNDKNKCDNIHHKLKEILDKSLTFISRGDDSGTHKKEIELWNSIGINSNDFNKNNYLKVGQGMGNTLLLTNEKSAYTISDRGTWISFNKKNNLKIICENTPPLFNQYGIILVNPSLNSDLNIKSARIYIDWLLSREGENLINNFKKMGQQLFFYNYK